MRDAKICIGLINPKSPTNVGAVMRAAGCFRVNSVCYSGERFERALRFNTDTQDRSLTIPLEKVGSVLNSAPDHMNIVAVELVEGATSLIDFEHPQDAFYIFGPEDGSLSQDVIDGAHSVVYIPTVGCLNLAATVNIVLYDRMTKSKQLIMGDELIRQSRDTNNRVKLMKENSGK